MTSPVKSKKKLQNSYDVSNVSSKKERQSQSPVPTDNLSAITSYKGNERKKFHIRNQKKSFQNMSLGTVLI